MALLDLSRCGLTAGDERSELLGSDTIDPSYYTAVQFVGHARTRINPRLFIQPSALGSKG